ncbi:MAG: NAD(P)/FAD-dependent oxidoreductase [Rhodobacteraceae bacterium]|nr:NAD(P)/FAD-dependent oxidoreductase [Paracoccaceae bacterium]
MRTVLVVGAGLAGLATAYALRRHGHAVTILEAAAYPGGRIAHCEIDGFRIDLGANLLFEFCPATRQLAKALGVQLRETPVPVNSGIYRNNRFHGLYGGNGAGDLLKMARTILSFQLLSPKGVWQVARLAKLLRRRREDLGFDDTSRLLDFDRAENAAEFLASRIGTESFEWLFGPGLTGYTFAHPEQVGAPIAMVTAWHTGLSGAVRPSIPEGGLSAFVSALSQRSGAEIRLSTPVRRIVIENGAARGVITDSGTITADAVVCATTATAALAITPDLPPAISGALGQVTYSRCLRVFFGVDASPFPKGWYAVAFPRQTGALMIGMSDAAVLAPDCAPAGKALIDAVVIDSQAEALFSLDNNESQLRVLAEIRRFLPEMQERPLFAHTHRWHEAACLMPGGSMTALHKLRQAASGNVRALSFAGDYMGVPSIEAAIRSGLDAATAIHDIIG